MEKTLGTLATEIGVNYDTLYRRAKTRIPSRNWSASSALSDSEAETLSGGKSGTEKRLKITRAVSARIVPAVSESVVQEVPTVNVRNLLSSARSGLLLALVIGHAGLVWYDCATLWGVPGLIGGGLVFGIVLAAVMFAADPSLPRTSGWAMWFVALVDAAAFWVHKPVFMEYGQSASITNALCIFVCACSFVALYLFRDSKLD